MCAALPGGDPNLVTDEFAGHLTLDHRGGGGGGSGGGAAARGGDLISFLISYFIQNTSLLFKKSKNLIF